MSTRKTKLHALSAVIQDVKENRNLRPVIRETAHFELVLLWTRAENIPVIFLVPQWALFNNSRYR